MLYREIFAVCSEIHAEYFSASFEGKIGFFNVKPGGTFSNLKALIL
jgi:hypothetical protein